MTDQERFDALMMAFADALARAEDQGEVIGIEKVEFIVKHDPVVKDTIQEH